MKKNAMLQIPGLYLQKLLPEASGHANINTYSQTRYISTTFYQKGLMVGRSALLTKFFYRFLIGKAIRTFKKHSWKNRVLSGICPFIN